MTNSSAQPPDQEPAFIEVGNDGGRRRIAVRARAGAAPGLFWLGGFNSDMQGTKAIALDAWAAEQEPRLRPVRLFRPWRIRRRVRRRHHRALAGREPSRCSSSSAPARRS